MSDRAFPHPVTCSSLFCTPSMFPTSNIGNTPFICIIFWETPVGGQFYANPSYEGSDTVAVFWETKFTTSCTSRVFEDNGKNFLTSATWSTSYKLPILFCELSVARHSPSTTCPQIRTRCTWHVSWKQPHTFTWIKLKFFILLWRDCSWRDTRLIAHWAHRSCSTLCLKVCSRLWLVRLGAECCDACAVSTICSHGRGGFVCRRMAQTPRRNSASKTRSHIQEPPSRVK